MEQESTGAAVDRLIEEIYAKLKANREILKRSAGHGHLTWRKRERGGFQIDLEPKL